MFTWAAWMRQTVPDVSAVSVSFACVCACMGNSPVSQWTCYWQLSPSPWAGEAACCVGRGYTCSGLVRPQYRCTSHLRPVPSCRSATPPLGWGIAPAETEKGKCMRTQLREHSQEKKLLVCVYCCHTMLLQSRLFQICEIWYFITASMPSKSVAAL